MFDIRDMQLLVALERHGHFARAADDCGISQPAFSARIRNLELGLNASIVLRGNRFMGFTPEGEIVLTWARKLLEDVDGMKQELTAAKSGLEGSLRIGVIPTALAFAAGLPALIRADQPKLKVEIVSASSVEIKRGLDNFSFGAGISYIEDTSTPTTTSTLLYDEEYVLLAPEHMVSGKKDEITWRDAAKLPLCLLSKSMRNRRIIDEIFSSIEVDVEPVLETNALTVSMAQVENGTAATIVPRPVVNVFGEHSNTKALDLVDPVAQRPIGLLLPQRQPAPPAHAVLSNAAKQLVAD
ncbi:MAG: LysR family transcriptional regulator [Hyphomicrobiales bacterium]